MADKGIGIGKSLWNYCWLKSLCGIYLKSSFAIFIPFKELKAAGIPIQGLPFEHITSSTSNKQTNDLNG